MLDCLKEEEKSSIFVNFSLTSLNEKRLQIDLTYIVMNWPLHIGMSTAAVMLCVLSLLLLLM
jgi:hypothetical protein